MCEVYWLNSKLSRIPLVKPLLRRGVCSNPKLYRADYSKVALRQSIIRRNTEFKPSLFLHLPFEFPPDKRIAYTRSSTELKVEGWGLNCSWYLGSKSGWNFSRQQIKKHWETNVQFIFHCLIQKAGCLCKRNKNQSIINLQLDLFLNYRNWQ